MACGHLRNWKDLTYLWPKVIKVKILWDHLCTCLNKGVGKLFHHAKHSEDTTAIVIEILPTGWDGKRTWHQPSCFFYYLLFFFFDWGTLELGSYGGFHWDFKGKPGRPEKWLVAVGSLWECDIWSEKAAGTVVETPKIKRFQYHGESAKESCGNQTDV